MIAIDLFAGLGGFSAGACSAGIRVAWAGNHWPVAVDAHRRNHPETVHACQDLGQQDWREVPPHDVLLASPACQGHSPARGKDLPHHDASRSTAWAVIACAEAHRPSFVVVENVPAFRSWILYPAWRYALERLGYRVAEHVLDAADFGVPQHRERVYVVATLGIFSRPLRFEPLPHVPASSVLDFEAGSWSPIVREGRASSTLERIARGREEFGARFLLAYYGTEKGGRALWEPLGTVTTRDRHALVDGDRMRMLTPHEARAAMGFPAGTWLPAVPKTAIHLLGNAVCPPVATGILGQLGR